MTIDSAVGVTPKLEGCLSMDAVAIAFDSYRIRPKPPSASQPASKPAYGLILDRTVPDPVLLRVQYSYEGNTVHFGGSGGVR